MSPPPGQYPLFYLIGDSIIQGSNTLSNGGYVFGAGLQEHCSRRLDLITRGLSGYNTAHLLSILPTLLPPPSPTSPPITHLLLLLGANDACLPSSPSKQHVPLEAYTTNLHSILTHPSITAHQIPKSNILLVTPPPIHEPLLAEHESPSQSTPADASIQLSRTAHTTALYAAAARTVAKDLGIVLIDLHAAILSEAARLDPAADPDTLGTKDGQAMRRLLVDGLHLTADGYEVFRREVVAVVGREWAGEKEGEPSWVYPHWSIAPRVDQ